MFNDFKKLGRHTLTYGLGDTINKVISILIVPIFTRFLTPADYGAAGVLLVTNTLLLGLCDLGLSNGITRFFSEEKEEDKKRLVATSQIAMVLVSLIIALFAWFFASSISLALFRSNEYSYIIALNFLTIPLTMAVSAPMMRWRLEEKAKTYAFWSVARVVTGVTLNVVLIIFLHRGLAGLFEGPFINAALYALIIGFGSMLKDGWKISLPLFRKMFAFAYPFIFGLGAFWIMDFADRLILTRYISLSELGLYNLGYTMGMAVLLPVGAFLTAWPPFFMSLKDRPDAPRFYSLVMTYYSFIVGWVVLAVAVLGRDYFTFLTPSVYHGAYLVVPLIALSYALKGNFSIVAVVGFIKRKTSLELTSDIIAMVLNLAAMFILIPILGKLGAAWATLLAYGALPISMYFLTRRLGAIPIEWLRLVEILIIGIIIYFICDRIYAPTLLNFIIRLVLIGIWPLYFYLIRFFRKEELDKLKSLRFRAKEKDYIYDASQN